MSMFREHSLPWKIVGFFSLALAPPGLTSAQAQQVPQGLDEALSGQVVPKPEPKRETPRIVLAPEFWSPSPVQSDFIRELRKTKTTDLPSADTACPRRIRAPPSFEKPAAQSGAHNRLCRAGRSGSRDEPRPAMRTDPGGD